MSELNAWRYIERFAVTDPARPFRILPIGKFSRFGRKVEITLDKITEMAANFGRVPETAVPINPEHKEETGKLGSIKSVEARPDGLYAVLDWLEEGLQAIQAGKFQYFSPEIIWGPTDYEGAQVSNILTGLALTNNPFFGNATALYSLEDDDQYREFTPEMRRQMADEGKAMPDGSFPIVTVQDLQNAVAAWGRSPDASTKRHIIKRARALDRTDLLPEDWQSQNDEEETRMEKSTLLEGMAEFFAQFKPEPTTPPAVTETEQYKALQAENTRLANEAAERSKAERITANISKYSAAVKVEGWETPESIPADLAAIAETDGERADSLASQFKALAEQARVGKLFSEAGSSQPGLPAGDAYEQFNALAKSRAASDGISITDAYRLLADEQPKLYAAYAKASTRRDKEE